MRIELALARRALLLDLKHHVFDVELFRRAKVWGPIGEIQAVTEYVLLNEVRRVKEFVGR